MPIAYADHDTLDWAPGSPAPYDEDYYDDVHEQTQQQQAHEQQQQHATTQPGQKTMWLGFTPPSDQPIPGALRARKSKSRKAMLRTMGADG